jgi:putative polyketide hydroxylase
MGVSDGFDLGWKLAWVMRGWADESLLDSYEAERRPVAEHNLSRSLDPTGSRRSVIDEVHVDLGPRLQHLWLPSDGRHPDGGRRSTLDLLTTGLTAITANHDAAAGVPTERAGVTAPVTVRRVDVMTARALGAGATGSVVLRPDGVTFHPSRRAGRRPATARRVEVPC